MAHIFAFFDESGKYKQHPIVSVSGLVGKYTDWIAMGNAWYQLLREYQIPCLHAVRALRIREQFGKTGCAATPDERAAHILPFISSVIENLNGLALAVTVDVKAYGKVEALHKEFTPDPHYFAFFMAINNLLTFFSIPQRATIGLTFDDEQEKAMRCYQLLKKLKLRIPEVKDRITSICFSDDRDAPAIQAADLFAYLSRLEAMRIFANIECHYSSLFHAFGNRMPTGKHLCMNAQFFDEDRLREFVKGEMRQIVFAYRARLPGGKAPVTAGTD